MAITGSHMAYLPTRPGVFCLATQKGWNIQLVAIIGWA